MDCLNGAACSAGAPELAFRVWLGSFGSPYVPTTHGCLAHCTSFRQRTSKQGRSGVAFATNLARQSDCLAGGGCRQELLWRQSFVEHPLEKGNRQQNGGSLRPDLGHGQSQEVFWPNKFCETDGVDPHLPALDMHTGRRSPAANWSGPDDSDPLRLAVYGGGVTAGTVSTLCQQRQLTEAVEALGVLVQTNCRVSQSLFYTVLKRCVVQKDLVLGRRLHALSVKKGFESDAFLCNHILRMYASHTRLQEAMDVFTVVAKPNVFMWSSIISAQVNHGRAKEAIQFYYQMCRSSVKPDAHVFVAALQACAKGQDLKAGQRVHADVLAAGVEPNLFVCNCLVDMYAKCGSLVDAENVFDGLRQKDVVTWNAMIAGYSQQGRGQEALSLYMTMQDEGMVAPDPVTFVCLLQACASLGSPTLEKGKQLHAEIREQGLEADVFVGCSLVNMYAKCGSLEDAHKVFDGLGQKDVVTWTALIVGYAQQGMGEEALHLYSAMQNEGIAVPDTVAFASLLQACASVGTPALENGKQLHAQIGIRGFQADEVVGCSLVNMYAKCGSLEEAQRVFEGLDQKNVVTWNAMIAGYYQQGMVEEAFQLYRAMQEEGIIAPDSVTFACLLQACASVAALELGRQLHAQIEEQGLQADVLVAVSLISMYAHSGSMVDARQVFEALPKRDVVAWSALIAGYTRQGDSDLVFDLWHKMREDGVQPASITFLSVLTVCSHAGLVNKGREFFDAMSRQYGISPTAEHYTCMVDLLGRAGQLEEVLGLIRTMPVTPDAAVWHNLLGACQKWSNVDVGRFAFEEAMKLDKKDPVAYVLISNIYTTAHMWEHAQEVQDRRKEIGAWKQPGHSWWTDRDGLVHTFLVGDKKHPEIEGVYARLQHLFSEMEKAGYVKTMQSSARRWQHA